MVSKGRHQVKELGTTSKKLPEFVVAQPGKNGHTWGRLVCTTCGDWIRINSTPQTPVATLPSCSAGPQTTPTDPKEDHNMLYDFTIRLAKPVTDAQADELFEADFHDVTDGTEAGRGFIAATVEADNVSDALAHAITVIESIGLTPVAVDDADTVTATQIAQRTGRSRESIRLLASGERGPGGFPLPIYTDPALYSWFEVARWFATALDEPALPRDEDAAVIAATSHLLRARALTNHDQIAPVLQPIFVIA